MENNIEKIVELVIDLEGVDEEVLNDLGVEVVSLVDEPAIQENFYAFNTEDEDCEVDHLYFTEEAEDALIKYCEENGTTINEDDFFVDLSVNEFNTVKNVVDALKGLNILKRLIIKKEEEPKIFYRYTGPPAERKFCKAMVNLSKSGKIFSEEEIKKMDGINSQFAKKGESSYSVLRYKGGKNCKHTWEKLKVFKSPDGKKLIVKDNPSNARERKAVTRWDQLSAEKTSHFFSIDEEKRTVIGPLMIPNKMILRRGENGEPYYVYYSKDTIKKMAEKFLALNKQNNTDVMHDGEVTTKNTLIESWVSESRKFDKSYKYGYSLPEGTWYVSYKINDELTWEKIKDGELKGFSLAGPFLEKMTVSNEQNDEDTLNKIKKILKDAKI